jgi:hypothetical protein
MFWLTIVGLLAIHLVVFVVVLLSYPQWRMIWFAPIVGVEAVLFGTILDALLDRRKR